MTKILYSGTDGDGNSVRGFIDTNSNQAAVRKLAERGYSDVILYDDAAIAMDRSDLDGLSAIEQERIAVFELRMREDPRFITFFLQVLKSSMLVIVIGLAIVAWGIVGQSLWLTAIGAAVAFALPLISLWNYRDVAAYDKLQRTFAVGDWDSVVPLVEHLRPRFTVPQMAFDLVLREAFIVARRQSIDAALSLVEDFREHFATHSPGMYESRIAHLYHGVGEYSKFLDLMRDAYDRSSQNPVIGIDLALSEARLGDPGRAAQLLDGISLDQLPPYGEPFVAWARGVISMREGSDDALSRLNSAVAGFMALGSNPAVLMSLAMCVGHYSIVLHNSGQSGKAVELASSVIESLKTHADEGMLASISAMLESPGHASES